MPRGAIRPAMLCYQCANEARAVCRFCGSAVCRDHAKAERFVSGVAAYGEPGWAALARKLEDYVVVRNAIWCGRCTVEFYTSD